MQYFIGYALGALFGTISWSTYAQPAPEVQRLIFSPVHTVCYASFTNENTRVPAPRQYLKSATSKTKSANIEVQYIGFSSEAQAAFQAAIDIWESLIISDVTIHITAHWEPLGASILGSASPSTYATNVDGVQKRGIWYPIALAEKIVGHSLNADTDSDIEASFNSTYSSWYFGTDGLTPTGKFDFTTIVLHEIGHGLGITHSYAESNGTGLIQSYFNDQPVIYETFLESQAQQNLLTKFTAPSASLGATLTGGKLFLNSPAILQNNSNQRGQVYAPTTYTSGSSIAHLDEDTYAAGDINSLMTPQIGFAESIHDPGPIIMGVLDDMGWTRTQIEHQQQNNSEDISTPFNIVCTIKSDEGYQSGTVQLNYKIDAGPITTVSMTPTGTPNEFSGDIPASGSASTYQYFISLTDNANANYANPGMNYTQGSFPTQEYFSFATGPDLLPPVIQHSPKSFLLEGDESTTLQAHIYDNIGIASVSVEYSVNNVAQPTLSMDLIQPLDSIYELTLTFPGPLTVGDTVRYHIIAQDLAVAVNTSYFPAAGYIVLPVEGLLPTQDTYFNDFNSINSGSDFFGDPQFTVAQPNGFSDGAIHTSHPYPNGSDANFESNFTYELKVPIRLKDQAMMSFDEIVLVEPGDPGAAFGGQGFYDYVIVEGSLDGTTWHPFLPGYDSRSRASWLSKFNSQFDAENPPNSSATGDPTLYSMREINMLESGDFKVGDEVIIRFRLFADQLVHGWGWSIDNLKIQLDDMPPVVLHDQYDYMISTNNLLPITINVSDPSQVASASVEYFINSDPPTTLDYLITDVTNQYTLNIDISSINKGDVLHYRVHATDKVGNEGVLPANGYFVAPVIDLNQTVTTYSNDFNSSVDDFAGNFFSIDAPPSFDNGNLHTTNPYPEGFGLDGTSNLSCLLKTPVVVQSGNGVVTFDELNLVQPNDYTVVEASKDQGLTWTELTERQSAGTETDWSAAWSGDLAGSSNLFHSRMFNFIDAGFNAGDKVLLRFRLYSNPTITGWGWAIDNLVIQASVTEIESNASPATFSVFPNPATTVATLRIPDAGAYPLAIRIMDVQGKSWLSYQMEQPGPGPFEEELEVRNWPSGVYLIHVVKNGKHDWRKFIVIH